jgi:hypothetical protein
MKNRIELFVSGNTSTTTMVGGVLDMFGDEDITVNYAIKDIRDFASTTSSYSQNFSIPGTKNNNLIFQNLFLIGGDGNFDPRKRATCSLVVDSIVIIEGFLQIVSIDVNDRDEPTYSVTIFSNVKGFNSKIKGKYLSDYDWSNLNHTLNVNSITNTWSGTPANPGYFYSIKDYGYDYSIAGVKGANNREGIPIGNMWPDIYNKTIIDKIFSTEGYSYDSNLLSSATFQNTVIPFCGDMNSVMGSTYLSARTFIATETTLSSITFSNMRNLPLSEANQPYEYEYKRKIRAGVINSGSTVTTQYTQDWANGDYYTFDQPAISQFSYSINYEYLPQGNPIRGQVGVNFYRSTYNNGLTPFHTELSMEEVAGVGFRVFTTPICNNTNGNSTYAGQTLKPFSQGEKVWAELYLRVNQGYVAPTMSAVPFKITTGGVTWKHFPSTQRTTGQLVDMNNIIPQKILVTDYLKSVFNMFNAYIQPSKTVPNRFTIEDFESFYAAGTQRDWSAKFDRSQPITETIISEELSKKYTFTYKEDKDFLNDDYKTKTNRVYGDWWYDTDNDFITKEEKVEVIFSPTPSDNIIGSSTFIVPKIGKYDNNGKFGMTNFNIRFLAKSSNPRKLPNGEFWRFTGTTTYNTYPYIGHLNDPLTGTTDYNWGSVPYVYYPFVAGGEFLAQEEPRNRITENNLINTYWKKYLDEISDKDAKLITAYFKLSPKDIWDFNFNDTVFVDGLTSEGGHYYRVNNIAYSTDPNKLSKVELIKVLTKYSTKYPSRRIIFGLSEVGIGHTGLNLGGSQVMLGTGVGIGNGNINWSEGSILLGSGNIASGGYGHIALGNDNTIDAGNNTVSILGSGNTVSENVSKSSIFGNRNQISLGSTEVNVIGDSNITTGLQKGSINGNNNLINASVLDETAIRLHIIGDGNVTYNNPTGLTINGQNNYIYGAAKNSVLIGDSNSFVDASKSFTFGEQNYVAYSETSTVLGSFNSVGSGGAIFVAGESNTSAGGSVDTTIFGSGNLLGISANAVTINGRSNIVYADVSGITIDGYSNTVQDQTFDIRVAGTLNNISPYSGQYSVVNGSGNTFFGTNSSVHGISNNIVGGNNITVKGDRNYVYSSVSPTINGSDNFIYTSTGVTVQGASNVVNSDVVNSVVYGDGNIVHSASTGILISGNDNVIPSGSTNISIIGLDNWTQVIDDTAYLNNAFVDTVLYMSNGSSSEQASGIAGGDIANAFGSGGTASGDYSFTTGYNNVASGYSSFATGSYSEAVGPQSFVYGQGNSASGDSSFVGGEFCSNEKNFGFITGKETVGNRYAEWARSSAGNYGQYGSVMAFGTTVSGGSSNLYLSISNDLFTIESNTSYMFKVKATAADYAFTSSGYSACFEGSCLLKNVGGTVSAVGTLTNQVYSDSILSSSTLSLAADNTNKALSIVGSSGTGPGMIWSVEVDYVKVKHNPL